MCQAVPENISNCEGAVSAQAPAVHMTAGFYQYDLGSRRLRGNESAGELVVIAIIHKTGQKNHCWLQ